MSNKKSLGSSPIGLQTQGSMAFIPDLGVAKPKKAVSKLPRTEDKKVSESPTAQEKICEKKTVSYYLEEDLIAKVKSIASEKEVCYSALVSSALRRWINENG